MKSYKLVIFDWDGTLMDSVARIISCMQKAATDHGLDSPSDDAVKGIIGLSLSVAMQKLHPGKTSEIYQSLVNTYSNYYKFQDTTPTPLFDGVINFLESLKKHHKLLAVATGKSRSGIDRVLIETQLKELFVSVKGADDAKSKPDPLMLSQILEETGVPVSDAIMIGDSIHDVHMAKNLGMDSIGVTWGVNTQEELNVYQPIWIADNIHSLQSYLLPL